MSVFFCVCVCAFLSTGRCRPAVSRARVLPGYINFKCCLRYSIILFTEFLPLSVFFSPLSSCGASVRAPQSLVLSSGLQQQDKWHKRRKRGREARKHGDRPAEELTDSEETVC